MLWAAEKDIRLRAWSNLEDRAVLHVPWQVEVPEFIGERYRQPWLADSPQEEWVVGYGQVTVTEEGVRYFAVKPAPEEYQPFDLGWRRKREPDLLVPTNGPALTPLESEDQRAVGDLLRYFKFAKDSFRAVNVYSCTLGTWNKAGICCQCQRPCLPVVTRCQACTPNPPAYVQPKKWERPPAYTVRELPPVHPEIPEGRRVPSELERALELSMQLPALHPIVAEAAMEEENSSEENSSDEEEELDFDEMVADNVAAREEASAPTGGRRRMLLTDALFDVQARCRTGAPMMTTLEFLQRVEGGMPSMARLLEIEPEFLRVSQAYRAGETNITVAARLIEQILHPALPQVAALPSFRETFPTRAAQVAAVGNIVLAQVEQTLARLRRQQRD